METLIRVIVLALTLTTVNAQDFQGIATYKTQRNIEIKMDSTRMNTEQHNQMLAMMKKQFQKTYNLTFNREVSIYEQEESLDKPQVGGGGFQMVIVGNNGGSDVLYKNTKTRYYADRKETLGKLFLVKDEFEKIDWKLESESKYIGEYLCFKATYIKLVEVFNDSNFNSDVENDNSEEKESEMEEQTVTAWYTPQIPVNNGPAMYQGLPGLILEIHDGKLTIICSKIVINPKVKVEIEEPTKGKVVNQKKYNEIMDKKNKEMMERYAPRKGSKDDDIEITIRG